MSDFDADADAGAELAPAQQAIAGPMVVLAWLVAAGWLAVAVICPLTLPAPGGWVLGGVGAMGASLTAWLALSLRVRHDEAGLVLPGHGHVPWADVEAVGVRPGLVCVPLVEVRRGRAVAEVALGGLAWFGGPDGVARSLAERIAGLAGVAEVGVHTGSTAPGRRALT